MDGRSKVSVIIPAFNHALFVKQCVDSALAQTYRDVEIVVVDDGSTDGTREILRSYGERIVYLEQENRGTQAARNAAIRASSGEFIALLDSDDVWLPDKLQHQMALFAHRPELGLVYSRAYQVDAAGARMIVRPIGAPPASPIYECLLVGNLIPALTAVFRRACIDDVGEFDESLLGAGDVDMWIRIAARWPVGFVDRPLALYRVHDGNTTHELRRSKRAIEERRRVQEKSRLLLADRISDKSVWTRARTDLFLMEAESEALAGEVAGCAHALSMALDAQPGLLSSGSRQLVWFLGKWAMCFSSEQRLWPASYYHFLDQLFSYLPQLRAQADHLYQKAVASAAINTVLFQRERLSRHEARALWWLAVRNDSRWLRSVNAWSTLFSLHVQPASAIGNRKTKATTDEH